jgi:hypothetical protein
MSDREFWRLIDASRAHWSTTHPDGNMERQAQDLERLLSALSPQEVIAFRDHLFELLEKAYSWDLWGAAAAISHGASEDRFADFRNWLVSMGESVYNEAIADPQSLAESTSDPGIEDFAFEGFASIPARVYAKLTGSEMPKYAGVRRRRPRGKRWSDKGDGLKRRYPRLWAKFRT